MTPDRDINAGGGKFRPLTRVLDGVDRAIEWSGSLIIFGTLLAIFLALLVNVFLRYAMGDGLAWAYEIHAILFPWLVAGGIAVAFVRGHHIAVDILVQAFPRQVQAIFSIAVNVLVCVIAVMVVKTSQPIINASKFQRLSEIPVSQYWGYISLYYAFSCMAVNAGLNVVRALLVRKSDSKDAQVSYS